MKKLLFLLLPLTYHSQSLKEVHSYLYEVGMKHPDIVMSQIIAECGWQLDSHNATVRHNLTGWTINGQLHTFNHWKSCLRSYKLWQLKYYKGGDYFDYLKSIGYASDKGYIGKVKSILVKLESC